MEIPSPGTSYYIDTTWKVGTNRLGLTERLSHFKLNLANKEDAEALVALAELITLRDEYNRIDSFDPKSIYCKTYSISYIKEPKKLAVDSIACISCRILSFKSKENAELFLNNFKPLIEKIKWWIG